MNTPSDVLPTALTDNDYADLETALDNGQFQMYLQFIYDIRKDSYVGVEALSRWVHPEKGLILPAQYIHDLHVCGLISRLDYQMLEKSCRLLEAWSDSNLGKLRVCCNFTRLTLGAPDFVSNFLEITGKFRFDHDNLVIEMTEDVIFDDADALNDNIAACREAGFRVALDDLGAGYTSFNDLCDYPVDIIKVDRHITQKVITSRGKSFLREMIKLAHHLGIGVLCEGVETEAERAAVQEIGCDYVQGFYYSRAFPAENAVEEYQKAQDRPPEVI